MRAQFLNVRPTKTKTFVTAFSTLLAAGVFLAYTLQTSKAEANGGQPVITSFVCTDNGDGTWTLSGTVSDPEGYSGMNVYFDEAIVGNDEVQSDGSFSWTDEAELFHWDWVDAKVINRHEDESDIVTWTYLPSP